MLYDYETWSLTLKDELRLKDILKQDPEANMWTQADESVERRRLHNEELLVCAVHLTFSGWLNLED